MALARARDLYKKFEFEFGHADTQNVGILIKTFYDVHTALFGKETFIEREQRPGEVVGSPQKYMPDIQIKSSITNIFSNFMALFTDDNGFRLRGDELTKSFLEHAAETYVSLRDLEPFGADTTLTLNIFFSLLNKYPGMPKPDMLDFRRLDASDLQILDKGDVREVVPLFEKMNDTSRTPYPPAVSERFHKWEDKAEVILGLRFLKHEENGTTYLVTRHGGLVPMANVKRSLEEHLHRDGFVEDFYIPENKIEKYLDEKLRKKAFEKKKGIDGMVYDADKGVPLICMDMNPLTGLNRHLNHPIFVSWLEKQFTSPGQNLYSLRDKDSPFVQGIIEKAYAEGDRFGRMAEIAVEHMHAVLTNVVDPAKERAVAGKTKVKNKTATITMGIPGSGKSMLEGENVVIAGLDGPRAESDIYHILQMLGHQADDYLAVEEIAATIRQFTIDKVLGEINKDGKAHNLHYDGTGIVFVPRYARLATRCKEAGYRVEVKASTAMLANPEDRPDVGTTILERIYHRALHSEEKRVMIWRVPLEKAVGLFHSVMLAAGHPDVDAFQLHDNAIESGKSYVMAEMHTINLETLAVLKKAKQEGKLLETLRTTHDVEGKLLFEDQPTRSRPLYEANVNVMQFTVGGQQRILVINNMVRFMDLMEQALIFKDAQGPDDVCFIDKSQPYLVPEMYFPERYLRKPSSSHVMRLQQPPNNYLDQIGRN
ncbi:MAG: hypothetical protein H6908_03060 [Hyphomicrobiales bacterium]|nr:hypothetical protein [Hyphomicrobiales bacterium]